MGMADQEQEWRPRNSLHAKSRQSSDGRQYADPRRRCVGARLLSEISKPPARLSQGVVECGELGRGRQELLSRASVVEALVSSAYLFRFGVCHKRRYNDGLSQRTLSQASGWLSLSRGS